MTHPEGFEVPMHRSLAEPMLMGGLPRTVALVLWTTVGALVLGLHQIWLLPLGLIAHLAAAALTKADPHFFDVLFLAIKTQRRLDP